MANVTRMIKPEKSAAAAPRLSKGVRGELKEYAKLGAVEIPAGALALLAETSAVINQIAEVFERHRAQYRLQVKLLKASLGVPDEFEIRKLADGSHILAPKDAGEDGNAAAVAALPAPETDAAAAS